MEPRATIKDAVFAVAERCKRNPALLERINDDLGPAAVATACDAGNWSLEHARGAISAHWELVCVPLEGRLRAVVDCDDGAIKTVRIIDTVLAEEIELREQEQRAAAVAAPPASSAPASAAPGVPPAAPAIGGSAIANGSATDAISQLVVGALRAAGVAPGALPTAHQAAIGTIWLLADAGQTAAVRPTTP